MNRRNFLSHVGAASVAAALPWEMLRAQTNASATASGISPLGKTKLQPFDYRGVKLLPGRFQRQVERTCETYFNLANDDILKGFRRDAGMPAPGNDLKGWASARTEATFGQWLSGMARLACALNDAALRDKAIALAEGWKETIRPDGNCRMGTYSWEKMACGLVDLAFYADYDRDLNLLEKITAWAQGRFDCSRSPAIPADRDGRRPRGTLEWYTLSENVYRAYLLTGKEIFKSFGDLWLYPAYWNQFENSFSPAGAAFLHSYSHINTFSSAAMSYAVTGDLRYLNILKNAYDYAVKTQAYVTGGYGPGEWSVPADGSLGRALEFRSDSAEIPCGSWAGFKISRYLQTFTGEARFADWMETLLYNGIGAALPVLPDGRTFYYADYRLGMATKLYHWDEWPCCSGTYLQTVADYHNVIYLRDESGLFVNLFVPSEATWLHAGQTVTVRQETKFPEANDARFSVQSAQPVKITLSLRAPDWAGECKLKLNDRDEIPFQKNAAGWVAVERVWQSGDTLQLTLEPKLHLCPVDPQHPRRCAVKYGPVLLAQEARYTYPLGLSGDDVSAKLKRENEALHFRVDDAGGGGQGTGSFKPFYEIPERLPYRVYFDLDAPRFL
jgi:hypothetical protein